MSKRVISVLLAVLCVIGSGAVLKLAEDNAWREYDVVHAAADEWVRLDEGISIRVTHVTLGRDMTRRGEIVGVSSGRFVLVEGEIRAEQVKASGFSFKLHAGDRSYSQVDENGMITQAGLISTYAAIFEVPVDAVEDLEVDMEDTEYISGYTRRLRHTPEFSADDVEVSLRQKVELPRSLERVIR